MNFTIDDVSGVLQYSSNNWKQQPQGDPTAQLYFENTYHVTQEDGATMSLNFNGTAAYIFGSKGPGHGNFTVRWAGLVQPLSAWAPSFQAQQVLWSRVFPTDGSEGGGPNGDGSHTILLTSQVNGTNTWLDIDFVTLTLAGNVSSALGSYTTTNAAFLSSLATSTIPSGSQASPGSSATGSGTSSKSSSNLVELIAAVILGALLVICIIGFFVYRHLLQKRQTRDMLAIAKEHASMRDHSGEGGSPGSGARGHYPRPSTQWPAHTGYDDVLRIAAQQSAGQNRFAPTTTGSEVDHSVAADPSIMDHDTEHLVVRDVHNHSAMGWSERTAIDQYSRSTTESPKSGKRSLPDPSTYMIHYPPQSNTQLRRSPSQAPSAKPPSYTAPYSRYDYSARLAHSHSPFEQIDEVSSDSFTPLQSPTSATTFGTLTQPLRLAEKRTKRASTQLAANIIRLAAPARQQPQLVPAPLPSTIVAPTPSPTPPPVRPTRQGVRLYDDGDSQRTNFLQV